MLVDFLLATSRLSNCDVGKTRSEVGLPQHFYFWDHGCAEHVNHLPTIN